MDEQTSWAAIVRKIIEGGAWAAVMLGGIGGVLNVVLDDKAKRRDVLRYFFAGAIISAGCGSVVIALLVRFAGIPAEAIPAGIAAGPASLISGLFGPRIIQKIYGRV